MSIAASFIAGVAVRAMPRGTFVTAQGGVSWAHCLVSALCSPSCQPMLYDVILVGFPDGARVGDSPAAALSDVFGIDFSTATRLLKNVPSVVKEGVPEPDARRYLAAFRYIGADARFRAHEEDLTLDIATGSFEVAPIQDEVPRLAPGADVPDGSWDVDTRPPFAMGAMGPPIAPVATGAMGPPIAKRLGSTPPASDSHMAKLMTAGSDMTPTGDEFSEWDPWSADSGVGAQFEEAARERLQRTADALAVGNSTNLDIPQNRSTLLAQAGALAKIRAAALAALAAVDDAPLPGLSDVAHVHLSRLDSPKKPSGKSHVVPVEELPPPPSPGPSGATSTEEISGLGAAAEREVLRRQTSKGLKHTPKDAAREDSGFTSEEAASLMEARLAARARANESASQRSASRPVRSGDDD
jgi:hypothetical protein